MHLLLKGQDAQSGIGFDRRMPIHGNGNSSLRVSRVELVADAGAATCSRSRDTETAGGEAKEHATPTLRIEIKNLLF